MLLLLLLLPDEGTGEGQARGEPLLFLEGRGQRHFLRDKHQASAPLEGRDRCAIANCKRQEAQDFLTHSLNESALEPNLNRNKPVDVK